MRQAHEQLHPVATRLLQRVSDDLPISPAEIDQFNNAIDRMRLEIQSLRREMSETLQNRDPLTGARNRVTLLSDLREQQALVRRGNQHCALAMLDLDHFKKVNDEHGHSAGDAVLAAVARTISTELRQYDRVYRYGGEEFLLCLPSTGLELAMVIAERIRAKVETTEVAIPDTDNALHLTVSIGITQLGADVPVEDSIDHADKAMYAAKANGRNRVEQWRGGSVPDDGDAAG